MHIDPEALKCDTEGDVEVKLLVPLLSGEAYLGIPGRSLFSKEYLAPNVIDKGAKVSGGYYPDFSVWMKGFPVLLVEAKAPSVATEVGYREAQLYARHLNVNYPAGFNPCKYILASNGTSVLFGEHDAKPELELQLDDLHVGGPNLQRLIEAIGAAPLQNYALECLRKVRAKRGVRPFNRAGGQAILNAKKPLNSFAPDLSPVLRRYFSSTSSTDIKEISEKAYVSSAEITEYDRVLEALLKDRMTVKKDTIVTRLTPAKKSEPHVEKAITQFADERPPEGQLQIIQGAVGAGKSLFIRRYKEVLQPATMKAEARWAFIDFNSGPADLSSAQEWLCEEFQNSFSRENPAIDLNTMEVLRGVFSRQIQRRNAIYADVAKQSAEQAAVLKSNDLVKWQDDPKEFAKGLAHYVLGGRQEVLIVVMDNVDRLDLPSQLNAFQLALWFMEQTKAFVILQMRDETYERFKNQPPLDTYRTGIAFHISPPRFIDVVKRRLELSIEYLSSRTENVHTYNLPSGARINIPSNDLGRFLHELYVELFERRRNISRILEALAGRDVRRALEMFVAIITSGHLHEDQITSQVKGSGDVRIAEHHILRILMRTGYRLFSDQSGFISNIFYFDNNWQKPSNFIIPEILFFLANSRKRVGSIGVEGYFSVQEIAERMQKKGMVSEDIRDAVNYLLRRGLVIADHMNSLEVNENDSVKITASGFIHLRVLAERIEYLFGIIATTPISDEKTAAVLADFVSRENRFGNLSARAKVSAVEALYKFLSVQANLMAKNAGAKFDAEDPSSGTAYVLREMSAGIDRFRGVDTAKDKSQYNLLDM